MKQYAILKSVSGDLTCDCECVKVITAPDDSKAVRKELERWLTSGELAAAGNFSDRYFIVALEVLSAPSLKDIVTVTALRESLHKNQDPN